MKSIRGLLTTGLAAATLFVTTNTHAAVVYSGPNQNVTYSQFSFNGAFSLFGAAGNWDNINLSLFVFEDPMFQNMYSFGNLLNVHGNYVEFAVGSYFFDMKRFAAGEVIDASRTFSGNSYKDISNVQQQFTPFAFTNINGEFTNAAGSLGYIGLRLTDGANVYYGWIQVSVSNYDNANMTGTLIDWAYETTPGRQILAGDTTGRTALFTKDDAVPGISNAVFKSVGVPAINGSNVVAFIGKWGTNIGVFANGALVTKKGDTIPSPSGTVTLKTLKDPVIDNANHVAFLATFTDGSSGVVSTAPSNTLAAVAQSGQQAADAPAGALWKNFQSAALPGGGKGALILGNMEQGPGGITAANDNGLWGTGSGGTMNFVLQEGTTIIGTNKVKSFKAIGPVAGVPGQTRSFNAVGTLAAQVTFTNGATAVVSVSLP